MLYHLIAGRPPFDAQVQSALMHQIYHQQPGAAAPRCAPASRRRVDAVIQRALAKDPAHRYRDWDEFAQALSGLITHQQVPRGQLQGVLDSERFNLLRSLEFFASFGDVELWEVVHRAKWQRFDFGHALYRKGEEGNTFHIIARARSRCSATARRSPSSAPAPRSARWPTWRPAPTCAATAPT